MIYQVQDIFFFLYQKEVFFLSPSWYYRYQRGYRLYLSPALFVFIFTTYYLQTDFLYTAFMLPLLRFTGAG